MTEQLDSLAELRRLRDDALAENEGDTPSEQMARASMRAAWFKHVGPESWDDRDLGMPKQRGKSPLSSIDPESWEGGWT